MRHTYACPMRWADQDAFNHVNNVVYVDYLQEARVDWQHGGPPSSFDFVMRSQNLSYLKPLTFEFGAVLIDVWVTAIGRTSISIRYEIHHDAADGTREVFLTADTVMVAADTDLNITRPLTEEERAWAARYLEPVTLPRLEFGTVTRQPEGHYPVKVRFSDIDVGGIVNNVKHLEYFQEARIAALARISQRAGYGRGLPPIVIARQEVEYCRPIRLRPEPYDAWTSTTSLGRTSLVMEAEIVDQLDHGALMARGRFVLVFFDLDTGHAAEPPAALRAAFL